MQCWIIKKSLNVKLSEWRAVKGWEMHGRKEGCDVRERTHVIE
jgi:hypothetical protein